MFVVSNPLAHLGTFTMPLHPKPIKRSGGGWENYFLPPLPLQKKKKLSEYRYFPRNRFAGRPLPFLLSKIFSKKKNLKIF